MMKSLFVAGAALLVFSAPLAAQTRNLPQNTLPAQNSPQQKIQPAPTPSQSVKTQRQGAGGESSIVNPQNDNRKPTVSSPDAVKKKTDYGKEDPLKKKEAKTEKAKKEVKDSERKLIADKKKAAQAACEQKYKDICTGVCGGYTDASGTYIPKDYYIKPDKNKFMANCLKKG